MLKELQDFGLSEKEAKVYLASLEVGRATADQLAKQAKVNRSTTYVQMESLMKKGLMSTYVKGKKTYFAPESPEYLEQILQRKRSNLESTALELKKKLPDLVRLYDSAGERPFVRFFDGKDGITAMREETLQLPRGETFYVMYSYDALRSLYSSEEIQDFSERREKKGLKIKLLYTRKDGKFDPKNIAVDTERRFFSHEKLGLDTDFFIYGDKVALMALKGKVFGIVIESAVIADSFRTIFERLWEGAEEE